MITKSLRLRPAMMALLCAVLLSGLPHATATPVVTPDEAWTNQFGSASSDHATAISATSSGVYVAGLTDGALGGQSSSGGQDAFVRRYDSDGDIVWTHQFGSASTDVATAVSATSSGIYVAGYTEGSLPRQSSSGSYDAFVRKYDDKGNVLWTRQFGSASLELAHAISVTSSGIYVAGHTEGSLVGQSSSGSYDAFVRKYDRGGNTLWTRQFGTASADAAYAIAATSSGIYVAGNTKGTLAGQSSAGSFDAFVRKYDRGGKTLWTNQFGTASSDVAYGTSATSSGIYVAGKTEGTLPGQSSSGGADAFVRRFDGAGNPTWTRQFGTALGDSADAIAGTSSGIYVAGRTRGILAGSSSGARDAFVRRYESDGKIVWTSQFGSESDDFLRGTSATSSGIYVAGYTDGALPGQSSSGGFDAFVRRYVSYRPDTLISLQARSGYTGNDVYNTTGASQKKGTTLARGNEKTFFVRAQNDGDAMDSFVIGGCRSSDGFKVTYLKGVTGSTDVTRAVVDGTYRLSNVKPGSFEVLRAVIKVTTRATVGAVKSCVISAISATSINRGSLVDVVRARVEARA